MNIQTQMKKGFTLIELMIVVAIIGILASVAIPAYQDYTRSATAAAKLQEANPFKTAVSVCYQREGVIANCDADLNGVPDVAGAVSDITDGVVTVALGDLDGNGASSVTITPDVTTSNAQITWTIAHVAGSGTNPCDSGTDPAGWLKC